jgi:small GTP-binding protein
MEYMHKRRDSIVLLGDWGVGKSSMLAAHTIGVATPSGITSTIGVSFTSLSSQCADLPHGISCWDTAGQERYRALVPMYTRGASAFICLIPAVGPYDVRSVREPVVTAIEDGQCPDLCHVALVMSKCDTGGDMAERLTSVSDSVRLALTTAELDVNVTMHSCSAFKTETCSAVFESCIRSIRERAIMRKAAQPPTKELVGPDQPVVKPRSRCC